MQWYQERMPRPSLSACRISFPKDRAGAASSALFSHLAVVSLTAPTIGPSKYGVGRPEDAGSRSKKLQLSMLTASLVAMVGSVPKIFHPIQNQIYVRWRRNYQRRSQCLYILIFALVLPLDDKEGIPEREEGKRQRLGSV